MNYQHKYHAGNFADVIKHLTLITLLTILNKKEKPLCYLETHAGDGLYDLKNPSTQKTKEYENGILKIIKANNPPSLIRKYLKCINEFNQDQLIENYPGSPLIAQKFLTPRDRGIFCELNPRNFSQLKKLFLHHKELSVHHLDGYQGLNAFLPPKEKRGLVLIDPPFEKKDEWENIFQNLLVALKKWPTGIFLIWYPIKNDKKSLHFHRKLKASISQKIFAIEINIYKDLPQFLNGCGLAVINPPWTFDQTIKSLLPWVWNALKINDEGGQRAFYLK